MDMPSPIEQPGTHPSCARVNEMLGRIGDKWTIMAISMLMERPRRFNELKRLIGGISQQMLTRSLRSLERDGLVIRKVYATVPPQVEYSLTPLGQSIAAPMMQMASWVIAHLPEIEEHRASYDAKA